MKDDAGPIRRFVHPFLLAATIRPHLAVCRERYPETAALLEKAFYVDDLIVGLPNLEKVATAYTEARKIVSEASMELRKWASNSRALRKRFLWDKVAIEEDGESPVMKVLAYPGNVKVTRLHTMYANFPTSP
ncbi:hypothetical protein HPB49_023758 [Dermacentor silvarum]|uniref:Uncharacterized protein n=1 Tax=Dermacentor silvarum TaxID=543639 RepID=A0ACB8DS17_DERSI|nr:hypothetical protein HPB49_023758 [Dermacentor silvarum]